MWNLLDRYVGAGILAASTVVANVCPFTAGHNEGKTLYDDIPDQAQALMHRLRVVTLNALGNPKKVGGFGGGVRKWIKKRLRPHPRELWTNFKGEIDDACVHLCLFTSVTKRNFVRAKWFDHFDHLVRFISGRRGAGAKLKNLLTKQGKFDDALAKRMEEDHRKLCKANAALYGFGGKYETQNQRDARKDHQFGGKHETQNQRDARKDHQFGGKHETQNQKDHSFGGKYESQKQKDARCRGRKFGTRGTYGFYGTVGLNVPPGAKCRVCGCDIGTGRALTLNTGSHNVQPQGIYICAGKCKKRIAFNMDQLKLMIKACNEHKRVKGGVRGFVNSFIELWHKKKKKKKKTKKTTTTKKKPKGKGKKK